MRPTLFYKDIMGVREGERRPWSEELEGLARILPRRCYGDCDPLNDDEFGVGHEECEGRGWLYPEMPSWFMDWERRGGKREFIEDDWRWGLNQVWRAMGILEEE